jgi:hypothetical protein
MPDIWFTADFGQPIVLCHYAMRVWNRSHHGAWHLYGHSRGNLPAAPIAQSRRLIDHREPTPRIACPYSLITHEASRLLTLERLSIPSVLLASSTRQL